MRQTQHPLSHTKPDSCPTHPKHFNNTKKNHHYFHQTPWQRLTILVDILRSINTQPNHSSQYIIYTLSLLTITTSFSQNTKKKIFSSQILNSYNFHPNYKIILRHYYKPFHHAHTTSFSNISPRSRKEERKSVIFIIISTTIHQRSHTQM